MLFVLFLFDKKNTRAWLEEVLNMPIPTLAVLMAVPVGLAIGVMVAPVYSGVLAIGYACIGVADYLAIAAVGEPQAASTDETPVIDEGVQE